jgi:hypothetical protein
VSVTCGPASSVTGASSTPGTSSEVFHIRLTPCGWFSDVVISAGSLPWLTAVAAYRMYQANRSASCGSPTWTRPAGSIHNRKVRITATSR